MKFNVTSVFETLDFALYLPTFYISIFIMQMAYCTRKMLTPGAMIGVFRIRVMVRVGSGEVIV